MKNSNRHSRALAVLRVALLLCLACAAAPRASAQSLEWPQWGRARRDFKSDVKGLAASWPETGPRRLWSRELGEGYSAIAAQGGRLFTMYRRGGQEVAVALDAASGKTLWEYAY